MHKSSVRFGKQKSEVRFGSGSAKKFLVRSFPILYTVYCIMFMCSIYLVCSINIFT